MVRLKISPDRFATACNVYEYLAMQTGDKNTAIKLLPRFVVDESGEYIIQVEHDEEGDIKDYVNIEPAVKQLFQVTPKRNEKLAKELQEAARQMVNPTNDGV